MPTPTYNTLPGDTEEYNNLPITVYSGYNGPLCPLVMDPSNRATPISYPVYRYMSEGKFAHKFPSDYSMIRIIRIRIIKRELYREEAVICFPCNCMHDTSTEPTYLPVWFQKLSPDHACMPGSLRSIERSVRECLECNELHP